MKILILTNQPYPNMIGGSANSLSGEIKYLNKNNHQVHIISSRGGDKKFHLEGIENYAFIHQVGFPYVPLGKSKHIFLLFKMMIWLIVNTSYFITAFFKSLSIINKIDIILIRGVHSEGLLGVLLKKMYKKGLVYEHAGGFKIKREKLFKQMNRGRIITKISLWFNTLIEKIVYRNCDSIINQVSMEDYYRQLSFKGNYHIIPNGRDGEIFYPRDESAIKNKYKIKGKVILFIGRFVPVKNIDKIIESFELIKEEASLVIVGTGILFKNLQEKSNKSLRSKDIHIIKGPVEVAPIYNIADIFVIASDYEGFPGVLIEAMACGKIVVAAPVGAIPNVIINNSNGYLLPENWTNQDLANGMVKGLNAPESIKINSKKTFDMNYSWDKVIKILIKIYQEVCNQYESKK